MGATDDLPFSCRCGTVCGAIEHATPAHGDFVVCHCIDCQNFALYMDQTEHILDQYGGTDLYQSRCAALRIAAGKDRLACLHMTGKPTLRWYAACCDTPMFNTYANGRIPYVTTLLANCDTSARGQLGAPLGHLFLEDSKGDGSALRPLSMNKLIRQALIRIAKDFFSGDRRRNPLFDPETLDPIASPRRMTDGERQSLAQRN